MLGAGREVVAAKNARQADFQRARVCLSGDGKGTISLGPRVGLVYLGPVPG
jgi:hypothetical protein